MSVKEQVERLDLPQETWPGFYSEVIRLNLDTLCSPTKWKAAATAGRKPLDIITPNDRIVWPTEANLTTTHPLLECPTLREYKVATVPG